MSKPNQQKANIVDISRLCRSSFTLTFAIEVLGIEVWHDCNEGWLDLGPCSQGMKIQYQLYPGQNYEADILIWPHTAKIWCGTQFGWVRTWQYLQRRWLSFSIQHLFPVRVADLQKHIATVNVVLGSSAFGTSAKNDKNSEVFLPPLQFGERRYFAPVMASEESLLAFMQRLIWGAVVNFIPASIQDGLFDVPYSVLDIRHQDTVIMHVQNVILNENLPEEEPELEPEPEQSKPRERRESKVVKEKEKKKVIETPKEKFEIKLSGDSILSGTGRIIPFETVGDRPPDLGQIIVLISSNSLPAQDDQPLLFVNVENLFDVPIQELRKRKITQLYTRWKVDEEIHDSEPQAVKSKDIKFNDHHALVLEQMRTSQVTAMFLDTPFEIQLRGIRQLSQNIGNPKFFGYMKTDRDFGTIAAPTLKNEDQDILIAVTKIDGHKLAKGVNEFIRGEYPLYPPSVSVVNLDREEICTNDINGIRAPIKPDLIVPPYVILEAQMLLEASLGLVGCQARKLSDGFSRLFALTNHTDSVLAMLSQINDINIRVIESGDKNNLLTGFALDTGDAVLIYLEGPRDRHILKVWDLTEDYYPHMRPVFSSSARYSSRIYSELLQAPTPFCVLKMYVPLGIILACPPLYARPAMPLPTRSAMLKIGRLIASKVRTAPSRCDMPTTTELNSFRLELCVAPRPDLISRGEGTHESN